MKDKNKGLNILNVDKLVEHLSKFVELKLEIYELKFKEQLVGIISSFATLALLASLSLFMIFFFSLALGFYLNKVMDSNFLGLLIVGIIYLVVCIILFVFKDKIITNNLFQAFFSDSLTIDDDEQNSD